MDLNAFFSAEMDHHQETLTATRAALSAPFARLVAVCLDSLRAGGKIVFFGNGGSAADAQHLACELAVRFKVNRAAFAAIALTTDTSTLTAIANDYSFDDLFARQVEALCRPGDVAIGISTSGNSENVLRGLKMAGDMGAVAAGLGGRDGGKMAALADPFLIVPSDDVGRIQEMHITLGHMLCGALETELA